MIFMKRIGLICGCLLLTFNMSVAQDFEAYEVAIPGAKQPVKLVPITGGKFKMGSPDTEKKRNDDEGPQRNVAVDGFWMGQYEITWQQYEAFVFRNVTDEVFVDSTRLLELSVDGVSGATPPYVDMSFGMGKEGYPAINMTQYAAVMYCKWLSALTGDFYRLPTEAEWEYACRAGTETAYSFGDDPSELDDYAVFKEFEYDLIGTKKPNQFQLYDMHGNVAEWTMDQYVEGYKKKDKDNPWIKPETLYPRVARGGHWKQSAEELRCASRLASESKWKRRDPQLPKSRWWLTNAPFVGFRIIRPFQQPSAEEINKYWLEAIEDYGL